MKDIPARHTAGASADSAGAVFDSGGLATDAVGTAVDSGGVGGVSVGNAGVAADFVGTAVGSAGIAAVSARTAVDSAGVAADFVGNAADSAGIATDSALVTWADREASRRSTELDRAEALRLLGSVSLGRIVFTQDALPAIRPVNHLLHHGEVIIRTHEGAALASLTEHAEGEGVVVAYEADAIDPATHCGWSVVVTGYCHLVTDPDDLAHYQALLHPWTDHRMSYALRIRPDLVTGLRLSQRADSDDAETAGYAGVPLAGHDADRVGRTNTPTR